MSVGSCQIISQVINGKLLRPTARIKLHKKILKTVCSKVQWVYRCLHFMHVLITYETMWKDMVFHCSYCFCLQAENYVCIYIYICLYEKVYRYEFCIHILNCDKNNIFMICIQIIHYCFKKTNKTLRRQISPAHNAFRTPIYWNTWSYYIQREWWTAILNIL